MSTKEKFQEAFDTLIEDFNDRIEEVKVNIDHLTSDIRTSVEGQKEIFQQYAEKVTSKYSKVMDIDSVRDTFLAETENVIDEVKERIDKIFDYVQDQFEGTQAENVVSDVMDRFGKTAKKAGTVVNDLREDIVEDVKEAKDKAVEVVSKVKGKAKKAASKVNGEKPAAKRGPGRPKGSKNKKTAAKKSAAKKTSTSSRTTAKRGPGRPKGSKNKTAAAKSKTAAKKTSTAKRGPGRPKGSKNKPKTAAAKK